MNPLEIVFAGGLLFLLLSGAFGDCLICASFNYLKKLFKKHIRNKVKK